MDLGRSPSATRTGRWRKQVAIVLLLVLTAAGSALGQARVAPDNTLTPGVLRALTDQQIRDTAWGRDRRHVTPAMRREVYRRYHVSGVRDPSCGDPRCELDHRVPRSCGGADDVGNLWPQSTPYWHEKDLLEDYAARQVKDGAMSPEQCQALFLAPADWRESFRRVFGREP